MDINSNPILSNYKEISEINAEHNITLVQNIKTKKIYVKKVLLQYNKNIYLNLKSNPIPCLPKVYEVIEFGDELIVIEEYISGDTIQEILDDKRPISQYGICKYSLQLCDCLNMLHSLNPPIIHRDIKPSNIMITPSKRVVLIDLNAAKYVDETKKTDTILLGTKGYAAPEQYGFAASNERTDIYALGILLKTLISQACCNTDHISTYLEPIIEKCTYIDPLKRYSTVMEVREAISKIPLLSIPSQPVYSQSKNWKSYLPPGYRSGNITHILIGTAGYSLLLWFSCTLEIKDVTPSLLLLERFFCFMLFLSVILISGNYMNVHKKLPFCNHPKLVVRILGIILSDFLAFFIILLFMAILETILL